MHDLRAFFVPAALPIAALFATAATLLPPVRCQEPAPATSPDPATNTGDDEGRGRRARRARRAPPIVIEAGTVHPVSGAPITDGVVVIRGDRIAAVGKRGEVTVPPNAQVRSFPTGHVYPGLIDAASDAFTDQTLRQDGTLDGGSELKDDLRWQGDLDRRIVQSGVTTAYVGVSGPAVLRGQGAIVRPAAEQFTFWRGKEQAALALRMTNGPEPSHPLQRQQNLQGIDNLFEGLEEYQKAKSEHEEALKKYEKDFVTYLEFHEKKKGKGDGAAENRGGEAGPRPSASEARRPGRAGAPGERPAPGQEPPQERFAGPSDVEVEQALATLFAAMASESAVHGAAQDPKPAPSPNGQDPKPQSQDGKPNEAPKVDENKQEGPKRPTYPKAPPVDPQKEALLRVLDGELPLRVEAHRADELRAALRLQQKREVPLLVLERAFGAAEVAATIAEQGATVVLTDLLPQRLPKPYAHFAPAAAAALLQQAGVPFAIATGNSRLSPLLPLIAATAVGAGLDEAAALRAITLTPAEILGIQKDTGSLAAGKLADVVVSDRPLFASDSRILLVLAGGRPEFEAQ
jgi:hypothetical protein